MMLLLLISSCLVRPGKAQSDYGAAGSTSCISTYADGQFTFPSTCYNIYSEGIGMNLTWEVAYTRVNLFYSQLGDEGNPHAIAINSAQNWQLWEIPTSNFPGNGNMSIPFHLALVNADGTQEEQLTGGIYSPLFFIGLNSDNPAASTVTTPVPTPVPTLSTLTGLNATHASKESTTAIKSSTSTMHTSTKPTAPNTSPSSPAVRVAAPFPTGFVVGAAIGGAAFIALIASLVWLIHRRRWKARASAAREKAVALGIDSAYFDYFAYSKEPSASSRRSPHGSLAYSQNGRGRTELGAFPPTPRELGATPRQPRELP